MSVRTAVFVYADDPVTQAGLEQLLRGRPEVHVLATGQIDDAVVAVVATDTIDDAAIRTIGGIQRDGCPRVVVVTGHLDEAGMLAATEAGTLGMLRRRDSSPEELVRVVRRVAAGEACVPPDLVGQLLGAVRRLARGGAALSAASAPGHLAPRAREVLRLLADGQDTQEIASTLNYSERTVKGVIHEITTRLQLRNRSHAVAFALRNDLI
jgi:DNA-binding NarL/FixJ family response regulator